MTAGRLQRLLLFGFVAFADFVIAKASFPLSIPLYQQFVHSGSQSDIGPRGVVQYDPSQNTPMVFAENSRRPDLASGNGVYRIGLYDEKQLGPAGFTKLVVRQEIPLTEGCH